MTNAAVRDGPRRETRVVGRYALYDEIASGGMATVHFGRLLGPVGFSRPVAIKRLHAHHAKDPSFTKMFIDEARLASRVLHPNVVQTLDIVQTDDELFLVMEYVQGESLGRLLRKSIEADAHVPIRIALAIMSNVLHGLHAAHEAKTQTGEPLEIVHRDVSPQNVMLGTDGVARVLDFGIARAKQRLEDTDEGNIKGKVAYMAPEQLAGGAVDRRADLYAAAVMLWELFAGRRLWARADAQTSLTDKILKRVERPSLYREDLPDALDAIVLHGLEKSPDKRFATAREFALAIEQYGPLAPPSEIGAWVSKTAGEALRKQIDKVAEFESDAPVSFDVDVSPANEIRSKTYVKRERSADAISAGPAPCPAPCSPPASVEPATDAPAAPEPPIGPPPAQPDLPGPPPEPVARTASTSTRPSRPSLRPSIILEEVQKFAPWKRPLTAAALGLASVIGAAALVLAVRGGSLGRTGAPASPPPPRAPLPPPTAAALAPAAPVTACPSEMLAVTGGKLFMGDDGGAALERPAHQVSVSTFCMDRFEVTVQDYRECSDKGDCKRAPTTNEWEGITVADQRALDPLCTMRDPESRKAHPINCIGWAMANAYCAAHGKRLPTEAEWEYAARGSDGRRYPWGDDAPMPALLNACGKECVELGKQTRRSFERLFAGDDGWPTTAPIGSFPRGRSPFGVEDLAGNVAEWTADWFAPYTSEAQLDPKGPATGKVRVTRGGGWNAGSAAAVRPTSRHRDAPEKRSYVIGFRCASALR